MHDELRRYSQSDWLAASIKTTLTLTGPIGTIFSDFLTEFVPGQRMDRLQDFVEKLAQQTTEIEAELKARLATSAGFSALAEQTALSAVRTASSDRRGDFARLLKNGLSKSEAELLDHQALLRLLDQIDDAQVLILMKHGNFEHAFGNEKLAAFQEKYPEVFDTLPPESPSSDEEVRRWTMYAHREDVLARLGLLEDRASGTKPAFRRQVAITTLGKILLDAIGRYEPER